MVAKILVKMQDRALVFPPDLSLYYYGFTLHFYGRDLFVPDFVLLCHQILSLFLRRHLRFPPASHSSRSIRYSTRSPHFPACIQTFSSYPLPLSVRTFSSPFRNLYFPGHSRSSAGIPHSPQMRKRSTSANASDIYPCPRTFFLLKYPAWNQLSAPVSPP